jgi:hypothetical protein
MNGLQEIIAIHGTQAKTGAVVGAKQQSVAFWLKNGVPDVHVIPLAASVEYRVTPHRIREDLYPHPDDGLPEQMRSRPIARAAE